MYRKDRNPGAFMSYAHADDDDGRISAFRDRLSAQTRKVIGEEFPIFQDCEDIKWGQEWEAQIDESLARVTFFIPIITPSFFRSKYCRDELTRFLEREERLGLKLILPVYYIKTPLIEDETRRSADELAQKIASRQYADCRDLYIEDIDSLKIRRLIFDLADQIHDALEILPQPQKLAEAKQPPFHRYIVVDPMSSDGFATISEAIAKAERGDKILVRPGLYMEGLVIDKPLEIVGDGERNEIEVRATGKDALLFKTTNGRVSNLTLRQMGGGKWFGVDISQGRLTLEDCDISSQSLACVAIHDFADPRLRRNKIHDGKAGGVFVWENGQGIIEDNEIFGNVYPGVEIKEGGNPTLRRNKIHDGKQAGVFVHENGQGIIEDNEIFGNVYPGVEIKTGGNPTLRRNKIHDGKAGGVFVHENGQGIIEDNEIFGNALTGVEIKTGGNPTLRGNRINRNEYSAILIHEGGGGVIEENDLRENMGGAWDISEDSEPNVKRSGNLE